MDITVFVMMEMVIGRVKIEMMKVIDREEVFYRVGDFHFCDINDAWLPDNRPTITHDIALAEAIWHAEAARKLARSLNQVNQTPGTLEQLKHLADNIWAYREEFGNQPSETAKAELEKAIGM